MQPATREEVEHLVKQLNKKGLARNVFIDEAKMREYLEKHFGKDKAVRFLSLWHGSPHSFKKFSLDFIGTGIGSQAYGYGLYFTDRKGIAEAYARRDEPDWSVENRAINKIAKDNVDSFQGDVKAAIEYMTSLLDESLSDKKQLKEAIKVLETGKELKTSNLNLYEVKIHGDKTVDDLNFMRWNKPITKEQKKILDDLIGDDEPSGFNLVTGRDYYRWLERIYEFDDRLLLSKLLQAGIDGVQYPMEYQREKGYNYVVFDDAAIENFTR
jgi:hypothetical protein